MGVLIAGVALACALAAPANAAKPNLVVVMSDDQPYWSMDAMPYTSSLNGLRPFHALYDNYALCCPARATFLTGLYSHHTGVEDNDGSPFNDSSTLATWLHGAGYETGLFGKYLNGYPFDRPPEYVPPGWDSWAAFEQSCDGSYFDYDLNTDGDVEHFGSDPADYSTDVVRKRAVNFIKDAPKPFFALVTPCGPHSPSTPAPRHVGEGLEPPWPSSPNFGRAAKHAPEYYAELPRSDRALNRSRAHQQADTLLSVDELNEAVVEAGDDRGDTIFLYLSDNGVSLGAHNLDGKRCGYEECGRVPGLIRGAGNPTGVIASNADLAPTLADLAGVNPPPIDGESLVPQLDGGHEPGRALLLRNRGNGALPAFWGLRTRRYKYLEHAPEAGSPHIELYDLNRDPHELRNLHGKPRHAKLENTLHARLKEMRTAPPG
jgi:N-acetylglucosamine-6-sulfatase